MVTSKVLAARSLRVGGALADRGPSVAMKVRTEVLMPLTTPAPDTMADDFSLEEIAAQKQSTLEAINAIGALWAGLVSLEKEGRSGNAGKAITSLTPALRLLFTALVPQPGEDARRVATKKKAATVFNVTLGDADHGKQDDTFEADLLLRRLERVDAQHDIADALRALAKRFDDDALNTANTIVDPGLRGIELARGMASNPEFQSLLAPVINALSDLTRAARAAQANARKPPKPKAEGSTPAKPTG